MKKGICVGGLPREGPLEERLRLAKRAGFDGVELNTIDDAGERVAARDAARAAEVEVPSIMASGHWQHPLSSDDEPTRQAGIANIKASVDTAATVGATHVLVVPAVIKAEQLYRDAYALSQDSVWECAAYAAEHGIYLAVENVWNKFLLTPGEMERYLAEIDSPWVGLYFDCGNILAYGFPEQWIRELRDRLMKVHVKDFDLSTRQFRHLLQGSVNWPAVRAALLEVGYDGYVTVELPRYAHYADQTVFDSSNQLSRILAGE